jgi:oligopeptide/dipeptide ABC transporter ATP-binding protein
VSSNRVPVLRLEELTISAAEGVDWTTIVDGVSLSIDPGEIVGLVGESGCGKSSTAYAVLGYARTGTRIESGRVLFEGGDVLGLPPQKLRRLRGASVALVPQNPGNSLTPSLRVGREIGETLRVHGRSEDRRGSRQVLELLGEVGLPDPEAIARRYPHQLSGGQQQRVVLALALACRPRLLVLDEPTTALDVTSQAAVLELLTRLRRTQGLSMLYVTHDLAVLGEICDRVNVMYAGQIVERGSTTEIFTRPLHPYTRGLIASMPHWEAPDSAGERLHGQLRRAELPEGCKFAPRCPHAEAGRCDVLRQELTPTGAGHEVACWKWPRTLTSSPSVRSPSAAPK